MARCREPHTRGRRYQNAATGGDSTRIAGCLTAAPTDCVVHRADAAVGCLEHLLGGTTTAASHDNDHNRSSPGIWWAARAFTRTGANVRRVKLIPIAGIAAALAVAASASAAALPAVVAEIGPAFYGSIQVRPAEIGWAGDGTDLFAGRRHPNARPADSEIYWTAWTRSSATGTAYSWLDNCAPDCADGSFTSYPVRVSLGDPGTLNHHRVFLKMKVMYSGRVPAGSKRRSTWTASYGLTAGDYNWLPT